jgi:hypothetical protein
VLKEMSGLYCGNFSTCRAPLPACRAAWCGSCYTPHQQDKFYQHKPTDKDGFNWGPKESHLRFRQARPGDHWSRPSNVICASSGIFICASSGILLFAIPVSRYHRTPSFFVVFAELIWMLCGGGNP